MVDTAVFEVTKHHGRPSTSARVPEYSRRSVIGRFPWRACVWERVVSTSKVLRYETISQATHNLDNYGSFLQLR